MKNLLLLILLGGVGVFVYHEWQPSLEEIESSPVEETEQVEEEPPVNFSVKMRVKRILDEWKNESLQAPGRLRRSSMVDIPGEITEIRRRLQSEGRHDAQALRDTMVQAAVELGYARDQAALLVDEVLAARRR